MIALIAGGLVAALCLVAGLGTVAYRVLVNAERAAEAIGDDATSGEAAGDPRGEASDPPGFLGDPFASTPAALFADGEAGIELPAAEAVGDFSAQEVAGALEQVRRALVATRIDTGMLVDRDPRPFLRLMAQASQDYLRDELNAGRFAYFATQLADGAELAVATPKVDGTITYHATVDEGGIRVVEIATSFAWVYAFEVPAGVPGVDGIVVVRDQLVWHLPHEDDVTRAGAGLWLWEGEAYAWGIDCDAFDLGLLGPQTEPLDSNEGVSDDGQIYDPEGSLDLPNTC